jgi:AAA15 family ATPase/GTPase
MLVNRTNRRSSRHRRRGRPEASNRQDEVLGPLRILEPHLQRLSLLIFAGNPVIHCDIGLRRLVPVNFLGEGFRRLLSILLAIANARGGIVLVDEIDTGLHHSVIQQVFAAIGLAARDADVQVFATTHSYECIMAAHRAFSRKESDDLLLHRLDRIDGHIPAVTYDRESLETSLDRSWEVR